MKLVRKKIFSGALSVVCLAGCVGDNSRYPSLALRDFETRPAPAASGVAGAGDAQTPIPMAASAAQIGAIMTAAETAIAGFSRLQPIAANMVRQARGQSMESDARARAMVALADLNSQRSATYVHLGDLDQLAATGTAQYQRTDAIDAARSELAEEIARQDMVLSLSLIHI